MKIQAKTRKGKTDMRNQTVGHRRYVVVSCMVLSLFIVMGQALASAVIIWLLETGKEAEWNNTT